MALPQKVRIVEVGPRDGLQNEKSVLETEDKFRYISLLKDAGLQTIEVTSFVKPPAIPQMRDAAELFTLVRDRIGLNTGINFPCLVPNMFGYEKARDLGVKEIALFSATSDSFTRKNVNASVDETFGRMKEVAEEAKKDKIRMRGYISTAFVCPYEGKIDVDRLISVAERFLALGVYEVSVGDTIGAAVPGQVKAYLKDLFKSVPVSKTAMHFHDTRGMALANILVSLEEGVSVFDSSSGGLGGCPYAKGATGNVATEDVWYLLQSYGIETGIDLKKLSEASLFILDKVQRSTESKFLKAYQSTGKV